MVLVDAVVAMGFLEELVGDIACWNGRRRLVHYLLRERSIYAHSSNP